MPSNVHEPLPGPASGPKADTFEIDVRHPRRRRVPGPERRHDPDSGPGITPPGDWSLPITSSFEKLVSIAGVNLSVRTASLPARARNFNARTLT